MEKDRYPLPLISDLLTSPAPARIYSKIDLKHAYHLVCITEGDEPKTVLHTLWLVQMAGNAIQPLKCAGSIPEVHQQGTWRYVGHMHGRLFG